MPSNVIGNYRWTICALLFFATTINYMDRQVLSLLKPSLEDIYQWTNSQYADITAAFQFTYALALLFAGRIVDRLGTKNGYTWAIILWSVGAVIHAVALPIGEHLLPVIGWLGLGMVPVSVAGFIFARAFLAVGEAGNFPAAIKATAEYFPKKERSFATGIFNSGANIGAVLAPLSVPWLEKNWGWQAAFIVIGGVGFIWLVFWWIFYEHPAKQRRLGAAEKEYIEGDDIREMREDSSSVKKGWMHFFRYRQTWLFITGKFMTDGVWWFFLFWLPAYLKDNYNMTPQEMMWPLAVLYSMTMIGSVGGGFFPTYYISRGMKPFEGRMKAMLIIACIPLVVLLAQPLSGYTFWIPVLLIGIGTSAHQAWSANMYTTVSDLFPKSAVATVIGIGGMAGGIGGVMTTKVGGYLFDHYKLLGHIETGYSIMFVFCALAYLIAWMLMKLLVPREWPVGSGQ